MTEAFLNRTETSEPIDAVFADVEVSQSESSGSESVPDVAPGEMVVGWFLGFGAESEIFVSHPLRETCVPATARSMVPLTASDIGREVVLNFERGDVERPLIVGLLWTPPLRNEPKLGPIVARPPEGIDRPSEEELVLTAGKRIVLRCGEANLTLTEEGKVLIQGTYVSSRSTGLQRIKGASVQIN